MACTPPVAVNESQGVGPASSPFLPKILATIDHLQDVELEEAAIQELREISLEWQGAIEKTQARRRELASMQAEFPKNLVQFDYFDTVIQIQQKNLRKIEHSQKIVRSWAYSEGIDVDQAIASGIPFWRIYMAMKGSEEGEEETVTEDNFQKPFHDVLMLVYNGLVAEQLEDEVKPSAVSAIRDHLNRLSADIRTQQVVVDTDIDRQERHRADVDRQVVVRIAGLERTKDRLSRTVVQLVLDWKHRKEEEQESENLSCPRMWKSSLKRKIELCE